MTSDTELQAALSQINLIIGRTWPTWQTVDLNEPDGPVLFKDKAGNVTGWCSRECWDYIERAAGA